VTNLDLDAKRAERAAAAEGAKDVFTFTLGGETFTVPPVVEWPVAAFDALADKDLVAACRALLPDNGWERMKAAGALMSDLVAVFEAVAEWQGLESVGN
jgi:hypothetical protein